MAELPHTRLEQSSPIVETKPAEGAVGDDFLNLVVELSTGLSPEMLLRHLQAIEVELGRESDHPRLASRTIDLDILYAGNLVLSNHEVVIPHPRMHLRRFVLTPLADIRPDLILPGQQQTVAALLAALDDPSAVQLFVENWI